ncbi:hypothetical protein LIER_07517 [Lithospermum erythrorhizon]|uniref:PB1 domain-containing protein n=1 Tax=Lithospermum erythrorhizon TaxID=34254 RepID=A0AAV3PAE9_LITER
MAKSGVIVKLMFSYGGNFVPHPGNVGRFIYAGGESKLSKVNRRVTFLDLVMNLRRVGNITQEFYMQYQLPGFDSLVTVYNDDDSIETMMMDYDNKVLRNPYLPKRLRLFLFYYPKNQPGDLLSSWDWSWSSSGSNKGAHGTKKNADGTNDEDEQIVGYADLMIEGRIRCSISTWAYMDYNFNRLRIG